MRFERLSRWNGSVGVLSSVSILRVESADILRSFSSLMFSCSCCSLPGVNISSTSVRNIFPLNTSTIFVVTSFKVHLAGVSSGGSGLILGILPSRLFFAGFFCFPTDIALGTGVFRRGGWTDDLGFILSTPRCCGECCGTGASVSYHPWVAAFASASAFPTAWNAASVSRINCSTFSVRSSMSES